MWYVALYSFIAGVGGTFLGGVLGALVPKKHLGVFNSVASGIMLALVCLELIPDTFKVSGLLLLVLGVAAGVLAMEVLRLALDKGRKGVRIKTGGILMFFAIALHNFPEGLAIGGSEALASGIPIAILIALHDIPEGLVVAAPLIESGVKRWKAALYAAVSG
ncbi:MAG TPA: ZIP family metal transporter, partial [Eubacteriales bacterium]|nr:ZIP family metal transporter [Eubacteriales bacterium]